jgi:uncharacterized protein (TIGR04255 family)
VQSPDPLPSFVHPPVVEVALGVQFEPIERLTTPEVARYWLTVQDRFPEWEERPPLPSAFEWFGAAPPVPARVQIELLSTHTVGRALLQDATGNNLVQVQQDRFIRNWRKLESEGVYPRYKNVRAGFSEELRAFAAFIAERNLGALVPNQCEVTYVNHIEPADGWTRVGQAHGALMPLRAGSSDGRLGEPEAVHFSASYLIAGDAGAPVGRLHVAAKPSVRRVDGVSIIVLTLTARGAPAAPTTDAVLAWLDRGREAVVRGFNSITTPEMHRVWKPNVQ